MNSIDWLMIFFVVIQTFVICLGNSAIWRLLAGQVSRAPGYYSSQHSYCC